MRASHGHSAGGSRGPALGGMQQLMCRHHIFLLKGTNYPHASNISSHFHNQLTSALCHQASEKGVVTQLLKDGRDSLPGMHNKGWPSFLACISEQEHVKQKPYRSISLWFGQDLSRVYKAFAIHVLFYSFAFKE